MKAKTLLNTLAASILAASPVISSAAQKPLTFTEKTKITKMSKAACGYEEFEKSYKVQSGTFKVTVLAETVNELGIISSANCNTSKNPDGFVCSFEKLDDCKGVGKFDFCKKALSSSTLRASQSLMT